MRYLLIDTRHGTLPITQDEARDLARRLRAVDPGPLPSDYTAAAIHLERAIDTLFGERTVSMNQAETSALYTALQDWLRDVSAAQLGGRLMNLRSALLADRGDDL